MIALEILLTEASLQPSQQIQENVDLGLLFPGIFGV